MTKANIVDRVSAATGLTKVETETVIDGFMSTIINTLKSKGHVELRGFGTFGIKKREPRLARNPGTGETVQLPERFVPVFKPSMSLKKTIRETLKV